VAASFPEGVQSVAARRASEQARRRRLGAPLPNLPITIVVLGLVNLGLVAWRADIVRLVPQTQSARPVICDVTTTTQARDGVPVLLLQGRIVGVAKRTVEVPRLRFACATSSAMRFTAGPHCPRAACSGRGEALSFQSRLASAPPETHAAALL